MEPKQGSLYDTDPNNAVLIREIRENDHNKFESRLIPSKLGNWMIHAKVWFRWFFNSVIFLAQNVNFPGWTPQKNESP